MQENEFEKQVKDAMEGLRFSPSAPVWEKIKLQIEKKKRRVWPFFLLLILVAILGGYLFYTDIINHHQTIHEMFASTGSIKKETTKPSVQKKNNIQPNSTSFNLRKHPSAIKNPVTKQDVVLKQLQTTDHFFTHNETVFNYQSLSNKKNVHVPGTSNNINDFNPTQSLTDNIIKQQKSVSNKIYIDSSSTKKTDANVNKINIDSSERNIIAKNDSTKSTKKLTKKDIRTSKWRWGITTMFGRSNLTDNLNLNTAKSTYSAYVNNPGTFTGNTVVTNPYKTATSYTFGVVIKRNIFKQSFIRSGLNYVHLSNKSTTAINLNSSIIAVVPNTLNLNNANSYYRYGSQKTYTNTFNFIELPVTFESNLFHIKQFALTYTAGFSVMHLLSSKALIYDSKSNSFLSDNNLIKHTQFQLLGGLNMQLNTKRAGSFSIGPKLEYSLSTFLKNNDYNHLHFINYGLQATWMFHKK